MPHHKFLELERGTPEQQALAEEVFGWDTLTTEEKDDLLLRLNPRKSLDDYE